MHQISISHFAFPGNCSWGWNECFQGPERGIYGYHRVPCCSSASLLADSEHHCCRKELHHHLSVAHRHDAGHLSCKTLAAVGGGKVVCFLLPPVNTCSTKLLAYYSLRQHEQSGNAEEHFWFFYTECVVRYRCNICEHRQSKYLKLKIDPN